MQEENDIKRIADYTKVTRDEAYRMYVDGRLTREQMYEFITARTFYLHEQSLNQWDEEKRT